MFNSAFRTVTANNFFRIVVSSFLLLCIVSAANAQLMFNIRAGGMVFKKDIWVADREMLKYLDSPEKHVDFNIGLEAEIPLSERFYIETGLRYHNLLLRQWTYENLEGIDNSATSCLELPLRFAYNQKLNDVISIRAGIGPYAQYNTEKFANEKPWQVGLEPNLSIYFKNFNVGAFYHVPLYKGYMNEIKPHIEVTIGLRISTNAMSNVGMVLGATAGAIGTAASSMQESDGFGYAGHSNINSNSSSSKASIRQNESSNKYSLSDQQNFNTDKRTCELSDSKLSQHFKGSLGAKRSEVENFQKKIKDIRKKWEQKGKSLPNYPNENISTSGCPETFHKH